MCSFPAGSLGRWLALLLLLLSPLPRLLQLKVLYKV